MFDYVFMNGIMEMARELVQTELAVSVVSTILKNKIEGDLKTHKNYHLDNDKQLEILIFERYSWRNNSSIGLTIMIDNKDDITTVEALSVGSGSGLLNFDFGSGKSYANSAIHVIHDYCEKTNQMDKFLD
jgi:Family of unknown function (DUF6054)